mgnify:CR=1 FL=1
MTKQTKQEAIKLLSRKKVYTKGENELLLTKLFELGFVRDRHYETDELYCFPFIFIDVDKMEISLSNDVRYFRSHDFDEISADYIAELQWVDTLEPNNFKPFDKVLVRDSDDREWQIEFFSHNHPTRRLYVCSRFSWEQCIPYEGNEHLLGTIDKPNN